MDQPNQADSQCLLRAEENLFEELRQEMDDFSKLSPCN
jgi:hypothetical protein